MAIISAGELITLLVSFATRASLLESNMNPIKRHKRDLKRFFKKIKKGHPNECWEWKAGRFSNEYGMFWVNGQNTTAHRFALEQKLGRKLLDNHREMACHSCDNPPCCNPNHLFVGNGFDNTNDAKRKGRLNTPTGGINKFSKLSSKEVRKIRLSAKKGRTTKQIQKRFQKVSKETIRKIVKRERWSHI